MPKKKEGTTLIQYKYTMHAKSQRNQTKFDWHKPHLNSIQAINKI